VAPKRKVRAR
jgi:hypothetical protein